ncbi:hypothetical protein K1719_030004 [Acacia pycnantha]|nr:hypothetical protein K1719_030004 [Acacia pycnantha]
MLSGQHTRVEGELSGNGNALNGSQVDVRNKEFNEAYEKGNVINGSQVDETNQELVEAFSKGNLIHSSQVDETNKESVEASTPDFQVSESLATPEDVTQNLAMPKTNLSHVTVDVIVETFPLRSVTSSAIGIESSGEFRGITNSPENETKFGLAYRQEKFVDDLGNTSASGNDEEDGKHVGHIYVKSTIQAALEEHVAQDNEICADVHIKAPDQSNILTAEVIEQSQTISGAKDDLNERRVNGQLSGNSQKINPTLERINLESWDGKPKISTKQEINPILAVLRAFIDAFVKFWSE